MLFSIIITIIVCVSVVNTVTDIEPLYYNDVYLNSRNVAMSIVKEETKEESTPSSNSTPSSTGQGKFGDSVFIPSGGMAVPLYIQYLYNKPIGNMSTLKVGGCGYCSLAMTISYVTNKTITPPDIIDKVGSKYHTGSGISWSAFSAIPKLYNAKCSAEYLNNSTSTMNKVKKALKAGKPVICSQTKGKFTGAGHVIVLRGITDSGKILVNDPNDNTYRKNHYKTEFDFASDINSTARAYWVIEKR